MCDWGGGPNQIQNYSDNVKRSEGQAASWAKARVEWRCPKCETWTDPDTWDTWEKTLDTGLKCPACGAFFSEMLFDGCGCEDRYRPAHHNLQRYIRERRVR